MLPYLTWPDFKEGMDVPGTDPIRKSAKLRYLLTIFFRENYWFTLELKLETWVVLQFLQLTSRSAPGYLQAHNGVFCSPHPQPQDVNILLQLYQPHNVFVLLFSATKRNFSPSPALQRNKSHTIHTFPQPHTVQKCLTSKQEHPGLHNESTPLPPSLRSQIISPFPPPPFTNGIMEDRKWFFWSGGMGGLTNEIENVLVENANDQSFYLHV